MSLSYETIQKVRVLSKNPAYFDLVDVLFPTLMRYIPSGQHWEQGMTDDQLEAHVSTFIGMLQDATDESHKLNCNINGTPDEGEKVAFKGWLAAFKHIATIRPLRDQWQEIMFEFTLNGKSEVWRKSAPNGTNFTEDWKRFRGELEKQMENI